jgi:MFS family permease
MPSDKPSDKASAKARRAKAADEDAEPLMAELEKAPPAPREEALRAQANRRFEEPPPRALRFSLYFFVASGGIWLLSMVASLIYKQDIINNEIKRNTDPKITADQIAGAVNQILWIVTVAAIAFTVFLALFGYKAREGARRARTLVTIFSVVLILFHLLLNGTQLGILSAMFALVGLALLWSPSSRKYFPPRQVS